MRSKKQKPFCYGKFKTLLLTSSVSMGIEYIMLLSDTIIIGNIFGEAAIAASNLIMPLFSVSVFVGTMISAGTSVMYSFEMGKFNKDRADSLFGQGMLLSVIFGLLLFLLAVFGENIYFGFMDPSETVETCAREYYKYYRFVILLYPLYEVMNDMVYSDGDELICNISNAVQVFVNIPASIILCKTIGIAGASLGTLIGSVLCLAILSIHFFRKQNSLKFVPYLNGKDILKMAQHGVLNSSIYLFWGIATCVVNKFIVAKFGDYYLPVFSVIVSMIELAVVFDGVGQAIAPFVGVYLGEKNTEGIRKVMRLAAKVAVFEGIAASVLFFIFGKNLAQIIGVTDPRLQGLCEAAVRLACPFMVFTSILFMLSSYYLLTEKITLALSITAMKDCIMILGLMTLGGTLFGLNGMWAGIGLTPLISMGITFLIVRLRYGRGKFPLILPKDECEIKDFDLILTEQTIIELRDNIEKILSERQIDKKVVSRIMLLTEELEMLILSKNPGKKVMAECTLMIGEDIALIFRDNGVIFDITDENSPVSSMRSYLVANMMVYQKGKKHLVTTSFNRNAFHFEKENMKL